MLPTPFHPLEKADKSKEEGRSLVEPSISALVLKQAKNIQIKGNVITRPTNTKRMYAIAHKHL